MSYISKNKPADKRTIKDFFSRKMTWLTKMCRDPLITDQEFRILYPLIVTFLSNRSDWCDPKDKTLGESCAKGVSTVRRITAGLKAAGHIGKQKHLGASHYTFHGLDLSLVGGISETRPLTYGAKTSHICTEDLSPVGRTEPSLEPSLEPKEKETLSESETSKGPQGEVAESQAITITAEGLFELFWTDYPHQVERAAALKAFAPALKRAGGLEVLLAGIERYVAARLPETAWLNPATFLNNDRWDDQPAPVSRPKSSLSTALGRTAAARLYSENWSAAPSPAPFKKPTDEDREAGFQKAEVLKKQLRAASGGKIK